MKTQYFILPKFRFLNETLTAVCLSFLLLTPYQTSLADDVLVKDPGIKKCTWDDFVENYFSDLSDNDQSSDYYVEKLEELHDIYNDPIDINAATREQLLELPFLTSANADSIISYINRYKPIVSYGELALIPGLDYQTRYYLTAFIKCASTIETKPTLRQMLTQGKNKITADYKIPFNKALGYHKEKSLPDSKRYLGDRYHAGLKYEYNFHHQLRFGLSAEKDAGEPFASKGNDLVDSYSFFLNFQPQERNFSVILGDYRVHFGYGLLVGNTFLRSKKFYLEGVDDRTLIKPHASYSERDYFRGAAGRVYAGRFLLTGFCSYKNDDATVNDSNRVTAIYTNGYHRTPSEMRRRSKLKDFTTGADITYNGDNFNVGMAGYYLHYTRPLAPLARLYNRYAMRGSDFGGASLHYMLSKGKFNSKGELAMSDNNAIAFLNTARFTISNMLRLTGIVRSYSKKYNATYAQSFRSSSRTNNEQGVMIGANGDFGYHVSYYSYVDLYRRPWATYNFPVASDFAELYFYGELHNQDRDRLVSAQLKVTHKTSEESVLKDSLSQTRSSLKIRGVYTFGKVTLNTIASYSLYDRHDKTTRGYSISQIFAYAAADRFKARISCSYFNTNDYNTRIYTYDGAANNMYDSYVSLYGKGIRTSAVLSCTPVGRFKLYAKYGLTLYFDRDEVGTGPQLIKSSTVSSLTLSAAIVF